MTSEGNDRTNAVGDVNTASAVASMAPLWVMIPSGRVAHLVRVCEVCDGRGWSVDPADGGPFGLASHPWPCIKCGGREEWDGWSEGWGWTVACGVWQITQAIGHGAYATVSEPARKCAACQHSWERDASAVVAAK